MARRQCRTERGVTHIDHLNAQRHAPERLAFYAFDLLWLDGEDLRRADCSSARRTWPSCCGAHPNAWSTAIIGVAMGGSSFERCANSAARASLRAGVLQALAIAD
jgi:hypothetical protein